MEAFARRRQSKDGFDWRCKTCKYAVQREDYAKHRETRKAGSKRWREANRAIHREAVKRWARANRDRKRELQAAYSNRHPERVLANARRQKFKRRGEEPSLESREYIELLKADPCSYCGEPMEHVDHIVARAEWGIGWSQWENLTSACQQCNCQKNARPLLSFLLEGQGGESNPARPSRA